MASKQNLELKHYCTDFRGMRKALKQLGATKERIKKQTDYFFDLPQEKRQQKARLKLRKENAMMSLIYYERPDFIAGADTSSSVELLEANKHMLSFLKKSLGVLAVVEKKREVWRKGNTVFHLDDVKGVGTIFEIELQKKGKITKTDQKTFARYQAAVAPYLGKVVRGSNVDLVLRTQQRGK